jgi:glycosyltransferase involved in cell wall biosynthesis
MSGARPTLIHVTTVDLSLRVLLAYQLRRFMDEGFDVVGASAPGPDVAALRAAGIRHASIPALTRSWTPASDVRALGQLARLFRRERPAIVHTHNPKSGVLGRVAARVARVPIVVNTVHGLYASPALPPGKRWVADRSERWAMRLSHHELFQSQEDLDRALAGGMVRPARASWLGNGVDLRRFDPAAVDVARFAALRSSWRIGDDERVVGTVGRLVREKGYEEFVAAAERTRGRGARFVAIGPSEPSKDDALSPGLLARAERAGVVFHGEGEPEDMAAIYTAFDVFVLASHREGMPRSAIEAQAMRRAVVATDIRGCREVVDDGVTGTLVPARDPAALAAAIRAALDDPARAWAMGERGRERALDRFDEDAVVERTLQVYRRLLREDRA